MPPVKTAAEPDPQVVNPLMDRPAYAIIQLGKKILAEIDRVLEPVGLDGREVNVLSLIQAGEGLSQQDLSRILGLDATLLGATLENLENRGVITRTRSALDRRRYILEVTRQGQRIMEEADTILGQAESRLLADVEPADLEAVRRAAGRILGKLT